MHNRTTSTKLIFLSAEKNKKKNYVVYRKQFCFPAHSTTGFCMNRCSLHHALRTRAVYVSVQVETKYSLCQISK